MNRLHYYLNGKEKPFSCITIDIVISIVTIIHLEQPITCQSGHQRVGTPQRKLVT